MPGSPKKRARRQAEEALRTNLPAIIPPPEEPKDRFGNASKFRPWMLEKTRVLCEGGATDKELASELGIDLTTLYQWRNRHPEFAAVMLLGRDIAMDRLERTAFEIACGYTTTVKEMIKLRDERGNEAVKEVERELRIPPDVRMLQWMLKNRRGDKWRDKTETEIKGIVVHLPIEQAREQLKSLLQGLRTQQLGNSDPAEG